MQRFWAALVNTLLLQNLSSYQNVMTSVKTLTHQSGQNSPTESWKLSGNKNLHNDLFSTGCLNIGHDIIHPAHFSCRTCSSENSIIICYVKILSCTCKYTPSAEFVFISECHASVKTLTHQPGFTKNCSQHKTLTNSPFGKILAKTNYTIREQQK
jgi:hypothetical protein